MAKRVPVEKEQEYIDLKKSEDRIVELKEEFKSYNKKGYVFKLLTVVDGVERFSPPWKDLVEELLKELGKSKKEIAAYHSKLRKRFPAKPVEPSFKRPQSKKVKMTK
jgi:hypothetical protein